MAMFSACASSFAGEKCSQKFVTANTPYAPSKAFSREDTSSRSAATTVTPGIAASDFALSDEVSRVIALISYPDLPESVRTTPPPCAPVAPMTVMILVSVMVVSCEV